MSYIRALSNPESMYAYRDHVGMVHISTDANIEPNGTHRTLSLPRNVFEGVLRKWDRTFYTNATFKGASLTEVHPAELLADHAPDAFKWRLTYETWKGYSIVAYQVTWCYVAIGLRRKRK